MIIMYLESVLEDCSLAIEKTFFVIFSMMLETVAETVEDATMPNSATPESEVLLVPAEYKPEHGSLSRSQ